MSSYQRYWVLQVIHIQSEEGIGDEHVPKTMFIACFAENSTLQLVIPRKLWISKATSLGSSDRGMGAALPVPNALRQTETRWLSICKIVHNDQLPQTKLNRKGLRCEMSSSRSLSTRVSSRCAPRSRSLTQKQPCARKLCFPSYVVLVLQMPRKNARIMLMLLSIVLCYTWKKRQYEPAAMELANICNSMWDCLTGLQ
jgi:hypothetical protein